MEKQKVLKTVRDFIEFFEGIPVDRWLIYQLCNEYNPNCHCANGHLGVRSNFTTGGLKTTVNSRNLAKLTQEKGEKYAITIAEINNGNADYHTLGDNPKERVLNYLYTLEQLNELSGSK